MEAVLFFVAAIGALGGAIGVVAMRNPFYGVLALIVHLFSLAVLFLLLTSAFVAAAQVVVYAGAVMVLYVFVVAYVGGAASRPGSRSRASASWRRCSASRSSSSSRSPSSAPPCMALGTDGPDVNPGFGDPAQIGHLLLERFLLPFEASSILLLLAAVGAVVLAARRRTASLRTLSAEGASGGAVPPRVA